MIVMEDGCIVEQGSPLELLTQSKTSGGKSESHFHGMLGQQGDTVLENGCDGNEKYEGESRRIE